jgi:hypothetical protein
MERKADFSLSALGSLSMAILSELGIFHFSSYDEKHIWALEVALSSFSSVSSPVGKVKVKLFL